MKDLKGRLADLERTDAIPVNNPSCASRAHCKDRETELEVESRSQSKTSPYPSPSPDRQQFPNSHPPDPNETEVESNLPPPYTLARRARARSRAHAPSLPPTSACISASNLGTTTSKEPRSQSLWSGQTQEQERAKERQFLQTHEDPLVELSDLFSDDKDWDEREKSNNKACICDAFHCMARR